MVVVSLSMAEAFLHEVFVSALPGHVSELVLRNALERFGPVEALELKRGKAGKDNHAFASFREEKDAEDAVREAHQKKVMLEGARINIRLGEAARSPVTTPALH